MAEFWRNREAAARDRKNTADSTADRLEGLQSDAQKVIREWANRLAIPDGTRRELIDELANAFETVSQKIEASGGGPDQEAAKDTAADEIVLRLEKLLSGKVGRPMSPDDHSAAVKEGLRRAAGRALCCSQGYRPGLSGRVR